MVDFNRNNLDKATSPYLRQHKSNPVHWQEWSAEILKHAKKTKKLILVSVGYSTCHWCHVMANGAFSDKKVSDYLNENFISVKVDKEQRPDLNNFLMNFLIRTTGQGGWPLNVFLTHELKPIYCLTYAGAKGEHGMP